MSGGRSRPTRPQRHAAPRTRHDWGWHALRADWARQVVAASPVSAGELVLDLGAGDGALTWPLLSTGARVLAFELHPGRVGQLRGRLAGQEQAEPGSSARLTIVPADLHDLRIPARPFRVVASPPYALTSQLVRLLTSTDRLLSADLLLQRGAALGWCERGLPGRHGRRYQVGLGLSVPRSGFAPPPRFDTVVLQIRRR